MRTPLTVVATLTVATLAVPLTAIAVVKAGDNATHSVTVEHRRLGPAACDDAKDMLKERGVSLAHPCRITTVIEQWENEPNPKAGDEGIAIALSHGCNVFKRKSCPAQREKKVRYVANECWGMYDRCTKHNSPVWWKVQQVGRYYKGWPCRVSRWIPGPYNCKKWYTWTRDNTWRWRHFNPPNKMDGFHRCNSVSTSGFTTSIDQCTRRRKADPSGKPRKFPYSNSNTGRVGMIFTACETRSDNCRTYRVGLKLHAGPLGMERVG